MAITVSIYFDFGGTDNSPGTSTDIDALGPPRLRFKLADNATIDTNDQMQLPSAGSGPYYSCWKHIYFYCDDPDDKTLSNIRLYSDGSNGYGTGCDLKVGLQFPVHNSVATTGYDVAHAAVSGTSTELVTGHGDITSSATLFNYTVSSPLTVSVSEDGSVIDAAGETSNYVLLQFSVANTASAGTTATETFYFVYDYT